MTEVLQVITPEQLNYINQQLQANFTLESIQKHLDSHSDLSYDIQEALTNYEEEQDE
jgi:hypothetical protein